MARLRFSSGSSNWRKKSVERNRKNNKSFQKKCECKSLKNACTYNYTFAFAKNNYKKIIMVMVSTEINTQKKVLPDHRVLDIHHVYSSPASLADTQIHLIFSDDKVKEMQPSQLCSLP